MSVATCAPAGPIHRLGRAGSVWDWPDWAYAGEDGTFGNRFDDATGTFRVLYASSQRLGAFLETLARFRPDPHVLAAALDEDEDFPTVPAGRVPSHWLADRAVAAATVDGTFADVGHRTTLAHLRGALAAELILHGLDDVDGAAIRRSAPRAFTQSIATYLNAHGELAGIGYASRLGDEIENWAIWEPADPLVPGAEQPLAADDPDLGAALALFGLVLSE